MENYILLFSLIVNAAFIALWFKSHKDVVAAFEARIAALELALKSKPNA